jgi:tetratricopeptide (TPR) repeat protein
MRRLLVALIVVHLANPVWAAPTKEAASQAAAAYQKGVGHFRDKAFDDAILAFSTAYRLDPNPTLIFNMARAFEEMKAYDSAIEYYRKYLEGGSATADEQARLPEKIRTLELLNGKNGGSVVVVEQTDWRDPLGWSLAAGGLASAVVAGVFFVAADRKINDAEALGPLQQDRFDALEQEHKDLNLYGAVAAGVGGAVLLSGVALLLWPGDGPPPVVITPSGGGVSLMGQF